MNWTERRVFVTGATGIVGSWLVKRLLDERRVRRRRSSATGIRRPSSCAAATCCARSVVNGRLEDYATLERAINEHEIDTVFHLGAQPIVTTALRNPLPTFEANIRGSYNLLEACRVHRSARHARRRREQRQGLRRRRRRCPTPRTCRPTAGIRTT